MGHFYHILFLQGSGNSTDEGGEKTERARGQRGPGLVLHSGALSSRAYLDKTCPGAIQPTVQHEGGGPYEPLLCLRRLQQLKGSEGGRVQAPHHK